jgi:hypothetical protein
MMVALLFGKPRYTKSEKSGSCELADGLKFSLTFASSPMGRGLG